MGVPGGWAFSYERGTPVKLAAPPRPLQKRSRKCFSSLLITEFIKEVSPLLPSPCHFQDYDLIAAIIHDEYDFGVS